MIHFFPKFSRDVEDTPMATELRRLGVQYRMFAEQIDRKYATIAGLLLRVYPKILWFALRSAVRSLLLSRPGPDTAVVTTDIEALVFGVVAKVFRRRTQIVFETFIATPKASPLARRLHQAYYRMVLNVTDLAICHSAVEARQYAERFAGAKARFVCLPYGMSIDGRAALRAEFAEASTHSRVIVSAGRSGRDYDTLAEAVRGLDCSLRIICDWERPTQNIAASPQVTILRRCFGQEYLRELARAQIVVVPLAVQDISAGQMVFLQAFALGKPVVMTNTATTPDYALDGRDALLVPQADVSAMRAAIERLLDDTALCGRLGAQAAARFDADFSTEAYVGKLVEAARELQANGASNARLAALNA